MCHSYIGACSYKANICTRITSFCILYSTSDIAPDVNHWCNSRIRPMYICLRASTLSGEMSKLHWDAWWQSAELDLISDSRAGLG